MNDKIVFTFEDIRILFIRKKKRVGFFAFLGVFFAFSFFWFREPCYLAEAIFFEMPDNKAIKDPIQELFCARDLFGSSSQSIALMKTRKVIRRVVESLGLAAQIREPTSRQKLGNLFKAEFGRPLPDIDGFLFQNVVFEGDRSRQYVLIFDTLHHFSVLDRHRSIIASGVIGEEIRCDGKFTLLKSPKNIRLHYPYLLQIDPWPSVAKKIAKSLTILEDKKNKSLFHLSFRHRDRHIAVSILNTLMLEYQRYLQNEYDELSSMQLVYLNEKQKQIIQNLSDVFDDHARYLQTNLDEMGWMDLDDGSLFSHQEMKQRVLKLEIELAQLDKISGQDFLAISLGDGLFFNGLLKISDEIWDLKNQKDLLVLDPADKKDLEEVLEGIDLPTAKSLFLEYNGKLDVSLAMIRNYRQIREEIDSELFEISSLSSILTDPYSQKLIHDAGQIDLLLKDEKHHSAKEGQRWQEERSLQKKILKSHLDQLINVEEIRSSLNRAKMNDLRHVSRCCIDQKISVLKEQFHAFISERKEMLLQEKEILESKMEDLRKRASRCFPDKWKGKQWLTFKSELGIKMMTTLTDLVESKTIGHHLHHIGSKPLDFAVLPLIPEKINLSLWMFLGAFCFGLSSFFFYFLKMMMQGFPVSYEKLQNLQYPVCGKISSEDDLEFLRKAAFFVAQEKGKVISLLVGRGPDYALSLARNLHLRSKRCVIIECDFRPMERKGILQLWKEEIREIPLQKEGGCDILFSGGFSPHGVEILQSAIFQTVLDRLKSGYDFVFMVFRSPLDSAEAMHALSFCDKVIITVVEEPLEQLRSFVHWACQRKANALTFAAFDYERTEKKAHFSHWWSWFPRLSSIRTFIKRRARSFVRG